MLGHALCHALCFHSQTATHFITNNHPQSKQLLRSLNNSIHSIRVALVLLHYSLHLTPKRSTNSQILIQHKGTLPYHPQENLAETFMKPQEKTMKSANLTKGNKEEALNGLLAQYRATPHPATGVAPGNIMIRNGYRRGFPCRAPSECEITEAIKQDERQRKHREQTVNNSTHRRRTNYNIGDQVYA